ncbi:MAG: hypothetical protein QY323_04150 [Patescibacteria group bacterium]|nr:MAG: hypothetical protein QY323_04150 [Patescibacteria group bacterium]
MKKILNRVTAFLAALATVASLVLPLAPVRADGFTSTSDTMSRLKISTTSNHTIRLTLPLSYTFSGSATTSDVIAVDFPAGFTSSASGTWATSDFVFIDGTGRTVTTVAQGAGVSDVSCGTGVNDVGVAVDTSANIFRVKACSASYTSSTATSVIDFQILGTAADGTLTNPGTAGSQTVDVTMTDMGVVSAHSTSVAVSIMDDDQVTVTATVSPTLTFDIDIQSSCGSESNTPYAVSLGTLTSAAVSTATNHICLDLDTNASGGALVTVQGSGSADALESSASGDTIGTTYTAGAGGVTDLVAGTEGYGLCVTATNVVTGSATAVAPYNGDCTSNGGNRVGGVDSAAAQFIVTTNAAALDGTANNTADILVKAAISAITSAANDYVDVLTFIATGTF